jgi:hypothetical protein
MVLSEARMLRIYADAGAGMVGLRAVADAAAAVDLDKLREVTLVWGTPGDVELKSDGGGDYASTYKLTEHGVQTISDALAASTDSSTPQPTAEEAWDAGYERAESDIDGTGLFSKRFRSNPYRSDVSGLE